MGEVKKQDLIFMGESLYKIKPNYHGLLNPVNTNEAFGSLPIYAVGNLKAIDVSNIDSIWLG
jgi:hypothetical protein